MPRASNLFIILITAAVLGAAALLILWQGRPAPPLPVPAGSEVARLVERLSIEGAARTSSPSPSSTPSPAERPDRSLAGAVLQFSTRMPVVRAAVTTDIAGQEAASTGGDGKFALACAGAPPRKIVAEHPDFVRATFVLGQEPPARLELPVLPRGAFRARVVDAQTGSPLPGARLEVRALDGTALATVFADNDARVEIPTPDLIVDLSSGVDPEESLKATAWRIVAEAEDHQPLVKDTAIPEFDTGFRSMLLSLEPIARRNGRVLGPDGSPVPGARVCWTWRIQKGLSMAKDWQDTQADEAGRFTWTGPAGTWQTVILAIAPEFAPGWTSFDAGGIRSEREIVVTLNEPCAFTGTIVDEAGRGVERVPLKLFLKNPPPFWNNVELLMAQYARSSPFGGRTDAAGTVSLSGVPPGEYAVRWLHPDLAPSRDSPSEVTLPQRSAWQGALVRGESLSGVCVSEAGEPLPEAQIYLRVRDEAMPASWRPVPRNHIAFDGHGTFFAFGLEKAPHEITAVLENRASEPFVISESEFRGDLVLVLKSNGEPERRGPEKLVLKVESGGAAIDAPWIEVNLQRHGTATWDKRVVPLKLGTAMIDDLAAGAHDVQVNGYGFAPLLLRDIAVPAAGPVLAPLEPAPFIHGKVIVSSSEPLHFIDVTDCEGRLLRNVPVGAGGDMVIPGLARGYYIFTWSRGDEAPIASSGTVLVDPGAELVVELKPVDRGEERKNG